MCFPPNPQRHDHNFSSVILNETDTGILSLGAKFCDVHVNDDQLDTEVQFEILFSQLTSLTPKSNMDVEKLISSLV